MQKERKTGRSEGKRFDQASRPRDCQITLNQMWTERQESIYNKLGQRFGTQGGAKYMTIRHTGWPPKDLISTEWIIVVNKLRDLTYL